MISSDSFNGLIDWEPLNTLEILDPVGHGSGWIFSPTSVVTSSEGSESERESSVMSEYDGAGVTLLEYLERVFCGIGDDGREISVRFE
jgi:hypothetical protein